MRILITGAFVAICGIFPVSRAAAIVVGGPQTYSGHTYYVVGGPSGERITWTAAEVEALTLGGHLVTVNDAAENQFIVDNIINNGFTFDPLWIGFTDAVSEGNFAWISGEPVTYTNWHVTEPNDGAGAEDYTAINWYYAFTLSSHPTWNDTPNGGTSGYGLTTDGPYFGIVEVVPEPAAIGLLGVPATLVVRRKRKS